MRKKNYLKEGMLCFAHITPFSIFLAVHWLHVKISAVLIFILVTLFLRWGLLK